MKAESSRYLEKLVRSSVGKIAVVNFTALWVFLFFSEFVNAMFNNTLDEQAADFSARLVFTFKPTVVALAVVFSSGLFFLVYFYLRPLFRWFRAGAEDFHSDAYAQARTAAIRVPWAILIFQFFAWGSGTTLYYALYGFQAESGIPYVFGLLLKLSVGVISGMYAAILINLIIIPLKLRLRMENLREGEYDSFSRRRDALVMLCSSFYIVSTLSYISYYYARSGVVPLDFAFYAQLFGLCLVSMLVSLGLAALSRHEYKIQIASISGLVQALAQESSDPEKRISVLSFNELGEISADVNTILDNFKRLLSDIQSTSVKISRSTSQISAASQENSAYANEQAAASTEVVSTMEDVDALSKSVGKQVTQVADHSATVNGHVEDGVTTIRQNIDQMDMMRNSFSQTIEGIDRLGKLIEGIWDVVKIINGIAGQIKIIAFNAALEASSAGEAGKNFEIVASEIRRLADNTVDSTREIKELISKVEGASGDLVDLSRQDAERIQDAWLMSQKIEAVFSQIRESSEASTESTREIQGSVNQQVYAFEQILFTMRQISEGISEFTASIDESNGTALTMRETVQVLNGIVERYQKFDSGAGNEN